MIIRNREAGAHPLCLDINRYKTIKQYIMTIEEIFSKEQAKDIIAELKNGREVPAPDVDAAKKALNPDLHDVNNPLIRKDKRVKVDVDEDSGDKVIEVSGGESTSMRIEKVSPATLTEVTKEHVESIFAPLTDPRITPLKLVEKEKY